MYVCVINDNTLNNMVDVAQLVEHQVVALGAVGSIPTIHPIIGWIILIRGMAQLVAHSLWERGVVSSSLAAPTTKNLTFLKK